MGLERVGGDLHEILTSPKEIRYSFIQLPQTLDFI